MLPSGISQTTQNTKISFGASYKKVSNIILSSKKDEFDGISKLINKEINKGNVREAYETIINAKNIMKKALDKAKHSTKKHDDIFMLKMLIATKSIALEATEFFTYKIPEITYRARSGQRISKNEKRLLAKIEFDRLIESIKVKFKNKE